MLPSAIVALLAHRPTTPGHETGRTSYRSRTGTAADRPPVGRDTSPYDFDLTGWLRSGKLLWLSPSDESATLRSGADGCPFVDLTGRRQFTVIANGAVRHLETLA